MMASTEISLALGNKLKVPKFPPNFLLLILIIVNLCFHPYSQHAILYEFLIYIYGILTLVELRPQRRNFDWTMVINLVVIAADLCQVVLTNLEESIIFLIMCWVWKYPMYLCLLELAKSFEPGTRVNFSQVFICLQYITLNRFIVYFTGVKLMTNFPFYIRIIQNLKIHSKQSLIAIGRFVLIIAAGYLTPYALWIKVMYSVWFLWVDCFYCYGLDRLVRKEQLHYPTWMYMIGFGFNVWCRMSWLWMNPSYAILIGVVRRIVENYFRLEFQAHKRQTLNIAEAIVEMILLRDVSA